MSFYTRTHRALHEMAARIDPFFSTTEAYLSSAGGARPCFEYVEPIENPVKVWKGRQVKWEVGRHSVVVKVPVEKVMMTEHNPTYPCHVAALEEEMRAGKVFLPPAGRLHRIDAYSVESTQEAEADGELDYQYLMLRPWRPQDAGTFYVQLLDGNHRYLAATRLGEPYIAFIVGPNYHEDVLPGDRL